MLPTWPNDTPFRIKDCRESIFASGSRLALHAEARVEGIVGGSVGVFELIQRDRARTHTEPKSAVLRLMVSHGRSMRSPTKDTPRGTR